MKSIRPQMILILAFWPLTALVLFADSRAADLQTVSNVLAPLFLLALMSRMPPDRRLLAALFVPISAAGEGLFSLIFALYYYRVEVAPLYVPFTHAILQSL